jgi:hypothetical protein
VVAEVAGVAFTAAVAVTAASGAAVFMKGPSVAALIAAPMVGKPPGDREAEAWLRDRGETPITAETVAVEAPITGT